jgi:hypothetical protein
MKKTKFKIYIIIRINNQTRSLNKLNLDVKKSCIIKLNKYCIEILKLILKYVKY